MVILVLEGASHLLFDTLIHEPIVRAMSGSMGTDLSLLFIQIYFFVVVIADLMRKGRVLPRIKMHPAVIFILSFLGIITVGTLLLMMPEMTTSGNGMPALNAFFLASSIRVDSQHILPSIAHTTIPMKYSIITPYIF